MVQVNKRILTAYKKELHRAELSNGKRGIKLLSMKLGASMYHHHSVIKIMLKDEESSVWQTAPAL